MKRVPRFYNSEEKDFVLKLSTRCDKFGNVFYCVDYTTPSGSADYVTFSHLSSALDFISSNFKA